MFIRENKTFNKKTQTEYVTHRLVESYQTDKGPRQRVIMHLGVLDTPKSQWRQLAAILEARLAGQDSLIEDNENLSATADQLIKRSAFVANQRAEQVERTQTVDAVMIDLNSVESTCSRSLGAELVGYGFWEKLEFSRILANCGFSEQQIALSQAVILGRLISPGSDLRSIRWFQNQSSLPELAGYDVSRFGKDVFYEIADVIYDNKDRIERSLRRQEESLFGLPYTLVLYDLTNTYLEGSAAGNSLAKRGKCKSNRLDCPLVTLALAVDGNGFPVFSHIYGGNQGEPETLQTVLDRIHSDSAGLFSDAFRPTVIMDRGIATKGNIALLQSRNYPYTVIERRKVESEYEEEFRTARETFEKLDDGNDAEPERKKKIYVKKVESGSVSRVLVYSEGRDQKESAIDEVKEKRFLEDVARLQQSVEQGNIQMKEKVAERVGKIKAKYGSIQRHYELELVCDETKQKVTTVTVSRKPSREKQSQLTGCYVIETTHTELTASEIWHQYMTLTQVENSFRDLKTDLGIRPIYHQTAERTKAHLFIGVLAYHLLISIEHALRRAGDCREWRTIRDILQTHQRTTIVLTGVDGTIYHLRVSGVPETEHARIYKMLEIKNPLKRQKKTMGSRK